MKPFYRGVLRPTPHPSRERAKQAIQAAPDGMEIIIREETRTPAQNRMIQPMIREFARKAAPILVNGEPTKLAEDDWRHILVSRFRCEQSRYALFRGVLILLGASSKELGVKEIDPFVEYVHSEAADQGFQLTRVEAEPV